MFCPQRNILIYWNSVTCNGFHFYYSDMVLLEWNSGHLFHSGLIPYFIQRFKKLHQKSRGLWSLRCLLSGPSHRELTLLCLLLNWQGLLCFLRRDIIRMEDSQQQQLQEAINNFLPLLRQFVSSILIGHQIVLQFIHKNLHFIETVLGTARRFS